MEQHPIPQQISSYEFKLVGEMTLKQFLKAAGGIVLAVAINASGLIFFLKYPLMLVCGGGGLMLAFVPFQDRPLDQWISAFIKAIYSPTIYTYKKTSMSDWMDLKPVEPPKEEEEEEPIPKKDLSKVQEFIKSLPEINIKESENEAVINTAVPVKAEPEPIKKENGELNQIDGQAKDQEAWRNQKTDLNLKKEKLEATGQAVFGEIPMPDKPDVPNLLVGMATDYEDKIVEGAIVEVQDENGNPSRVLKTNALGQFKATTPLADGKYLIITEKEGYQFDRVNIELKGEIVEPIKIKAILA